MKAKYLGIPVLIASSLFLSACTGGEETPDNNHQQTQSQPNGINGSQPKETKTADPNDPNQGRDITPLPDSTHTPPAGSAYDTSESGKGVDESKDAGDPSLADELVAPISSGGMGTQAGVAVVYKGKGFPPSSPVSIKILTSEGADTGIVVENATADAEGNLSARVYFPKNLTSGTYEVIFNGAGTEQKTKIDLIAGLG